ncbi:hypothetical protein J7J18_04230 [bacterium]|nr:hypothetical protein [bacterium]
MKTPIQHFLEIKDVRENIAILKDGSLRAILLTSSLNFALKSGEEQEAIIYQFQNLLNSLDFFCQIVVHTQRLNLTGYVEKLKELEENQQNKLLRDQTKGYREFIERLIASGTIMTKSFYLIVPLYPVEVEGLMLKKGEKEKKLKGLSLTESQFQKCKTLLLQRVEFLSLGLKRCGLNAVLLKSEQIIELFWNLHHPKTAERGYFPPIPPQLIR